MASNCISEQLLQGALPSAKTFTITTSK